MPKTARNDSATTNGDSVTIPRDALVVLRPPDGQWGYVINGESTVELAAWPTVLRRIAAVIEKQIVES